MGTTRNNKATIDTHDPMLPTTAARIRAAAIVGRFEIRNGDTGHLEASHATIDGAIREAHALAVEWGEIFFIIDLALPKTPADDRIVWRHVDPSDRARAWVLQYAGAI